MYKREESTSWGELKTMQELTRHENFAKTNQSKDIYSRVMKLETIPFLKVSTSSKTHTNTYTPNIFSKSHSTKNYLI